MMNSMSASIEAGMMATESARRARREISGQRVDVREFHGRCGEAAADQDEAKDRHGYLLRREQQAGLHPDSAASKILAR
jgi:hypothetical protein